jgi:acetyltransferase-like isoleucine patch superfamily enzyme
MDVCPDLEVSSLAKTREGVITDDGIRVDTKAIILNGLRLWKNRVVTAGCVVIRDAPEFIAMDGVPTSVLKYRIK